MATPNKPPATILIAPGRAVKLRQSVGTSTAETHGNTPEPVVTRAKANPPAAARRPATLPTVPAATSHDVLAVGESSDPSMVQLDEATPQRVVLASTGVQGPAGPGVLLRRVGTSAVVEWRWNVKGSPWQQLIDLGDGAILVQRQPPVLTVTSVTTVDDLTAVGVTVTQPQPLADAYNLDFRIPRGPRGPQGERGLSAYELWLASGYSGTVQDFLNSIHTGFRFIQDTPKFEWDITHPLQARFPNISVTDSTGRRVEGEVDYTGPHTLTITFSALLSGEAYLT